MIRKLKRGQSGRWFALDPYTGTVWPVRYAGYDWVLVETGYSNPIVLDWSTKHGHYHNGGQGHPWRILSESEVAEEGRHVSDTDPRGEQPDLFHGQGDG